jgi:hypothetical protein
MRLLNVLLVTYAFPPAGGVNVLRAASFARYFPSEDIRLDVLTTRNPSAVGTDATLLEQIPPEVTIHRTMTIDLPFGVKKGMKRLITGARPPSKPAGHESQVNNSSVLKRLFQDFLLPDPQVTWLPVLTRAARRIVRDREIDVLVITTSPYSTVLLAERLRKDFPALHIVLDFRDEWLATAFGAASFQFSRTAKARRFAEKAEASAVKSATSVVAVTEAARAEIRSRYPAEPDNKFLLIPNGFDASRLPFQRNTHARPNGRIVVTYVGSVYASTEPTTLVRALLSLPPEVKSRFKFRFIGHIEEPSYREALEQLGDMVELKGYLPQREALAALSETDYVLLITHDRLNISAKFYDYIGAGKPILACVHPEGDVRRLLEDLRAGWWADSSNTESICQLFLDTARSGDAAHSLFQPDTERIAGYERRILAQRYSSFLHSMVKKPLSGDRSDLFSLVDDPGR